MNPEHRTILSLDAGGTNFIFTAIKDFKEVITPFRKPAYSDNLEKCLATVMDGFKQAQAQLPEKASAISFAFPGPADYKKGVIGNLPNFKAFMGGVPLGPMLEDAFGIPVYIDNDGDFFAYGEALAGYLPDLNRKLKTAGSHKQFRNLIGLTLGTGFGGGIVLRDILLDGDSSLGAEVHLTLNALHSGWNAEESVSTRAIQRVYAGQYGQSLNSDLMPKDIADIALGKRKGNKKAALESFRQFGEGLGYSICNVLVLIDGIVVLGGGITASWDLFSPAMFDAISRPYKDSWGNPAPRLSVKVYNLEEASVFEEFAAGGEKELVVPGSNRKIWYDDSPRTGIGVSKLGASKAIALGAYAYAIRQLKTNTTA
jgi:glucokinase